MLFKKEIKQNTSYQHCISYTLIRTKLKQYTSSYLLSDRGYAGHMLQNMNIGDDTTACNGVTSNSCLTTFDFLL